MKTRIAIVTNIPTPYRAPLFDALAIAENVSLQVIYLAERHEKRRSWEPPEKRHAARTLRGRVLEVGERSLHLSWGTSAALAAAVPDVVVVGGWDQPSLWRARSWTLRRRRRLVVWIESHAGSGSHRGGLSSMVRRRFVRHASAAICPSEEAEAFLRSLGFSGSCLILPNAPRPPAPVLRPDRPASDAVTRLLFVGALNARKRPGHVIDLAEAMIGAGTKVEVRILGDGPQMGALRAAAATTSAAVELAGFVQAGPVMEGFWQWADCVILPSLSDPAPLVLSEAAVRGVPFVASDACGGATTLLGMGASGVIVERDAGVDTWRQAVQTATTLPRRKILALLPDQSARRLEEFLVGLASA